ncbi:PREDICTED: eukaryotic translation initiation factor 2A [Nicrophorus vespilloides]|uniref:Eukaryotic translation initiation factor 2A n=1 Tax=Nicrophorus vespilloides TaxID=110193 RepID=A0ABM1MLK5_NICVS|nr:PREDICTED: eukaryotic translation initiation factor 2A [Nicrophorus vespilloides]
MATSIPIAVRGSLGLNITSGPPSYGDVEQFTPVETKSCRITEFSPDGKYFAYAFGTTLKIVRTDTWTDVATHEGRKTYFLVFSPKSNYLMSWEPYEITKTNPQGSPNLNIYKTETGEHVKGFVHKTQSNWEPKWSEDEKLFSKIVNNDVVFYEDCNFERIVHRLKCCKVTSYSISPAVGSYYILSHTLGTSGQPSFARLFKYPDFDMQQAVASKSFFQADKVEYFWHYKGQHALVLTVTDLDKTGQSYYGNQSLHFIGVNGQTNLVSLSKEGPIYAVLWSPKAFEFCVVYGLMPARVTVFNLKCESAFEIGAGHKNTIHYNPQGNILMVGAFGNLRGNIDLWDMNTRKVIGTCEANDTTLVEWSPDGMHFLTATTAPRLRIENGYKIWHYSGALVYEKRVPNNTELYSVMWQKYSKNIYKEPVISSVKVQGIASSEVKASTQAYRPPSARNKPGVTFKLHDDDDPIPAFKKEPVVSKAALKLRKKREAKKARKNDEAGESTAETPKVISNVKITLTGDVEKDKQIKKIKKKLDAIEALKNERDQGKSLEINQLAKIKNEQELINELNQLQI